MPWVAVPDVSVNGVVSVTVYCMGLDCLAATELEELVVRDATTGMVVPGAILVRQPRLDGGLELRFRPDAPLVERRTYTIDWRPTKPGFLQTDEAYSFVALPVATWTLDDLRLEATLTRDSESAAGPSCETLPSVFTGGGECTPGPNQRRVTTQLRSFARLSVDIVSDDVPYSDLDRQYEVSAVLFAQGETPPALGEKSWPESTFSQRWDTAQEAYCYRVELHSFVDDSTALREDCLGHGALGPLEIRDAPQEAIDSELLDCVQPPEDLLEEYCRVHREACGESAPTCAEVEAQCAAVPREEAPSSDGGTGVTSGDASGAAGGVPDPASDAGPDDPLPTASPRADRSSHGGCAVSGARGVRWPLAASWLVACALGCRLAPRRPARVRASRRSRARPSPGGCRRSGTTCRE